MSTTTDREYAHIGQTRGMDDQDLVHDLSRRMDCLWRYDQYVVNADGLLDLRKFWNGAKSQELQRINELKKLIRQHVQNNCF